MCEMGKPKCQFPKWAEPTLGKNWRPVSKEAWYEAMVKANLVEGKNG